MFSGYTSKIKCNRIIVKVAIVIFGLFVCLLADNALAYSLPGGSLGSSRIVPDFKLFINGEEVEKPNEVLIVATNKPVFFGYTQDNVAIKLFIKFEDYDESQIILKTVSNNNGYWVCYSDKELRSGIYKVFMSIVDANNAVESEPFFIGTFKIPEVLPVALEGSDRDLIPSFSLDRLNYFTITLIVFGTVVLKTIFYLLIRKVEIDDE